MQRKSLIATVVFALTGVLLLGGWAALPNPNAWRPADGYLIQEAYRLGSLVAAATFPEWRPGAVPILVTNGRSNYLVNPWAGAPAGRAIAADGLRVSRLERLQFPVIANSAVPVNDRVVALITSKDVLEQAYGGMMMEMDMVGSGEAALVKGLLKAGAGRRMTPEVYVSAVLHESFHTYQLPVLMDWWDRLGDESAVADLWNVVYGDAANNRLQNREGQALLAAALATDEGAVLAAAREFVAAREERVAYWAARLGSSKAEALLEWEALYEWQEGLACYIQIQMYRVALSSGFESVPEVAAMAGYNGYRDGEETGAAAQVKWIGEPVESVAPRLRVYHLGAGQALVLDRLMPGWQGRAARGESLGDLVREAVGRKITRD